ncbi:MAG: zinc-ribbon domain-containing protein [Gemmatimonadaceae bacterium]
MAGVVLVVAIIAIIVWRVRMKRQIHSTKTGNLVRECSNCGQSLPPGATSCPSCGSDMSMFIA